MKQAYLREASLWEKPMTISEFYELIEAGRLSATSSTDYFRTETKEGLGVTVTPNKSESNVKIIVHERYGYPVLHNHDFVEIIYIASGSCKHFLDSNSFVLNEGDICILAPNAFHALSCTDDESCIITFMVNRQFFDQRFMEILCGGKILSDFMREILYQRSVSPYILFPTGSDPWLLELASRLITEATGNLYASNYSIGLLTSEFLLHIVREYEMMAIVPGRQKNAQNSLIVAALGYLSLNYNKTTLADTARFFGYSSSYFSRFIRENTGRTYNEIVTTMQMEKAVSLLKSGKTNLTEIAQEVGCFDSSHFNKKFRHVYNMSPKQYVIMLRAGKA
jgi:AraC-like DNA-binding protein/quercetin dioxygenase-like cupin family protein